jgi:DNA mismatch repair protein MutS2
MSFSLQTLEYEALLKLVSRHAQTPMGVDRFADLRPRINRIDLERDLAAISETIHLNEEKQVRWSFSGLEDPSDAVAVLKIRNATLEPGRLLEISRVCNQALFARSSLQPEKESCPTLWGVVENIPPTLFAVLDSINKKLLPSGEVDDSASPELAKIRREIANQRARLRKSLEAVMRSSGDAIQDAIVTVRNDRFVIPVKADFRGKVGGVAHGFSSSGATVFIEPLESIEANNELQNLKGKEEREVARILFELTEQLRANLPAIESAMEAVTELDLIKAKVEFARKFKAIVPQISDDDMLEFVDARHPLLEENLQTAVTPSEIVPSSFTLNRDRSVMIISGANAGGKTVVLKTAGLLSLMAISGLPVPARQARVPFYRSVLADIGDHQSLAANLSTFSSHMSNIAGMMGECVPPSLVLLDEAGTGTDPDEGSALGVAIVDHFRHKGAQVIASTHYRGLKMYAANDPNVINSSVEFDERTLQPTYRLLIGLAGASSGIEIARRFGIRQDVIDAARQNLDISAQKAEDYLRKLQTETTQAEDLRVALEEEREATALKYAGLEVEASQKEKARQKEFEERLAETVEAFERQSRAFIETLEDTALKNKLDKERSARKAELNRAVLTKVERVSSPQVNKGRVGQSASLAETRPVGSVPAGDGPIGIGSKVITSFGTTGTVEKLDKDTAEVLVGGMRLREKIENLRIAADQPQAETRSSASETSRGSITKPIDSPDVPAELNLIGKTTSEAEYELDRFIDEAYMGSLPRVRIIHGFGTGALKNYVHHFLKNHDLVERFAFAADNQGGHGATVAELKM